MNLETNKKKGFIKTTLIVIAALVLLKYAYDFDVISLLSNGKFRILLDKFYEFGKSGWGSYSEAIIKIWEFTVKILKLIIAKIG